MMNSPEFNSLAALGSDIFIILRWNIGGILCQLNKWKQWMFEDTIWLVQKARENISDVVLVLSQAFDY